MTNSFRSMFDKVREVKIARRGISGLVEKVQALTIEDNPFSELTEAEVEKRLQQLLKGIHTLFECVDSEGVLYDGEFVYQNNVLYQIVEGVPIKKDAIRIVFNSRDQKTESTPKPLKESFEDISKHLLTYIEHRHNKDQKYCTTNGHEPFDLNLVVETPKDGSPSYRFYGLSESKDHIDQFRIALDSGKVFLTNVRTDTKVNVWDKDIFWAMTNQLTENRNLSQTRTKYKSTEIIFQENKFARHDKSTLIQILESLESNPKKSNDFEVIDAFGHIGRVNFKVTDQGLRANYGRNPKNVLTTLNAPAYFDRVSFAVKPLLRENIEFYTSINDAARLYGIDGLAKGGTEIWYTNDTLPEAKYFRIGSEAFTEEDAQIPTLATLDQTHIKLGDIAETNLDQIYYLLQAPIWSPNGEAREFIKSKSEVFHTSMSVGDIVVLEGDLFMVDTFGFSKIEDNTFIPYEVEDEPTADDFEEDQNDVEE